jgi:hypothetical protein
MPLEKCCSRFELSVVLYKRLVLGEPQRKLPQPGVHDADRKILELHHEESSANDRGER